MASYFDEHSALNSIDEMLALLRRQEERLLNSQVMDGLTQSNSPPPPASKLEVEKLKKKEIGVVGKDWNCAICLNKLSQDLIEMPCKHIFDQNCLLPWLSKTNSCPSCRYELPTDNAIYEKLKKAQVERIERNRRVEDLHTSMYS